MQKDEATVATPCGADWNAMHPRGSARLCDACNRHVHDLSSMRESEARALLRRPRNERLCIRYLHDAYGNIWFGNNADGTSPAMPERGRNDERTSPAMRERGRNDERTSPPSPERGRDLHEEYIPASRLVRSGLAAAAGMAALASASMLFEACGGAGPYNDAYGGSTDAGYEGSRQVVIAMPGDAGEGSTSPATPERGRDDDANAQAEAFADSAAEASGDAAMDASADLADAGNSLPAKR